MTETSITITTTADKPLQGVFFLPVLTQRHSGYVGITVLRFDVQPDLHDVIRYYLQILEERLYMFFSVEKRLFEQKIWFLEQKGVFSRR